MVLEKSKENLKSFQNPCLTELQIFNGNSISKTKSFNNKYDITFIGRLEKEKGIEIIYDSLKTKGIRDKINCVNIIGDDSNNYSEIFNAIDHISINFYLDHLTLKKYIIYCQKLTFFFYRHTLRVFQR